MLPQITQIYQTPILDISIKVNFDAETKERFNSITVEPYTFESHKEGICTDTMDATSILEKWLKVYFADTLDPEAKTDILKTILPFEKLPLKGTPYQLKVWQHLYQIPFGKTQTYSEIATILGSHPRAIGGACRANPILLIIPCHRVTAKNTIGGFLGHHRDNPFVEIKKRLLQHETFISC